MPSPLPLPPFQVMLERMLASDPTADGLFITGVTSTGIYCLPSCTARKPKAENVVFFTNEEQARKAGLRPCKRCRPEDFYAGRDPDHESWLAALNDLDRDPTEFPNVASLAERMDVGLSKLHGLCRRYAGTTPGELIHQRRIQVAQRLLAEGTVDATEAAFAVGYQKIHGTDSKGLCSGLMSSHLLRRIHKSSSRFSQLNNRRILQEILSKALM